MVDVREKVDILIVDDRLDGLIALEAVLTMPYVNLVRAQSGMAALKLLDQYDFGMILLDVQMPELDGFETAMLIRKNEKYEHTPIIFVTAINKDDRYIYKGYEAGAVDYIFKPFEPQILRSKVNFFVDLYVKSRQLQAQAETIRESERRERYLKLAELEVESLKRYRNLADSIPHMIWKARVDGTLDYFNKVWTDYTGLPQEQSTGSGWQSAIHPEDLPVFLKTWLQSMNTHEPFEIECRMRKANGEMRWHSVRAVPELRRKDDVVAWLGSCTDIHDRKVTEMKLVDAEKIANSASAAKTNFLANMSHEIRTPLSAILGFAELMTNPEQTDDENKQCLATIRRSGRQLLEIIDEILDISKIEAGHLEIENIEVDIASLLSELQSLLNIQAQNKNLQLSFGLESKIPQKVFSDPTRIRQILMNIIGNAIKFTAQGKVSIMVSWLPSTLMKPARLQFKITDTGVGIEMIHAHRLFQPFMQVDSSTTRKFGGTGLGLALSRQLAQAMGGEAILEKSEPGKGSTFRIEVEAPAVDDGLMISDLKIANGEAYKGFGEKEAHLLDGIHVLLVDDAPDNQALISRFLTLAGAKVDLAGNGQEGIAKAMSQDYKVILMDIQMPMLDGYEATAQLRRQGYNRPIIALTAHALKEERDRCLKVGCDDHLTKPIDRRQLISQVARIVSQSAVQ